MTMMYISEVEHLPDACYLLQNKLKNYLIKTSLIVQPQYANNMGVNDFDNEYDNMKNRKSQKTTVKRMNF